MSKSVYIHAGAHRTGTSSFQQCLYENRTVLAERGLIPVYPGRDGAPGGKLRMQLPRPRHGAQRVPEFADRLRGHLARLCRDAGQGMVLSEENIPGPMTHFYEGRFFPASANRLAALAAALEAPVRHLVYVLRPYDRLYVSAYRKRAEDNAVAPFAELVPQFMAMNRGWPELVAEIRDILRPERLTVIDYAHRGSSRALLACLVPELRVEQLTEPVQVVNQSATDAALIALQARYRAGEKLDRLVWKAVVADHVEDRAPRGVAGFSENDVATLQTRYARDLERVAMLEGVALVA